MVNFIQPLDIETIFVNLLAGSKTIFMFLAVILMGVLAGRFRMPTVIVLLLGVLFPIIVVGYFRDLEFLVAVMVAFFIPFAITRLLGR